MYGASKVGRLDSFSFMKYFIMKFSKSVNADYVECSKLRGFSWILWDMYTRSGSNIIILKLIPLIECDKPF